MGEVGAEPGLVPEPAPDDEFLWCHTRRYIEAVKRFAVDPYGCRGGIGEGGDDPPFAGMHEAGAMVAGGSMRESRRCCAATWSTPSIRAVVCITRCRTERRGSASTTTRRWRSHGHGATGLRLLYVDLDVHHGDGVQAIHCSTPVC